MEQDLLLGALIGLARATDGSEHLITPSSTAVVIECLSAIHLGADLRGLRNRVTEEKRKMVPNCFTCACPCGRTSDCDLTIIREGAEPVRSLKLRILDGIAKLSVQPEKIRDESILYRALIAVGMDFFDENDLLPILREVE